MVDNEFNLSDELIDLNEYNKEIPKGLNKFASEIKIKEFIRLLKDASNSAYIDSEIDKLAGDKLI